MERKSPDIQTTPRHQHHARNPLLCYRLSRGVGEFLCRDYLLRLYITTASPMIDRLFAVYLALNALV